jgi:hypothetical protein
MDFTRHRLYKKAKFNYYFDRWKWVIWNAFVATELLLSARSYNEYLSSIEYVLFFLTALTAIFLLIVMPKTKFESSKECEEIKKKIKNSI